MTNAERQARWRERHPGAATRYSSEWRKRPENRERVNARVRLRDAVRRGRVEKLPCEMCGDPNVHAHHPFGYTGEMALAVWWLCPPHHRGMHGAA